MQEGEVPLEWKEANIIPFYQGTPLELILIGGGYYICTRRIVVTD